MSALNSTTQQHPKELLYAEVYDPLVKVWFDQLQGSAAVELLLREAPTHDLVTNLERFDVLCHELVDSDAVRAAATSEQPTDADAGPKPARSEAEASGPSIYEGGYVWGHLAH